MDDFLSKPISLADLRGALKRALSHQRPNGRIDGTPHGQAIRKEHGAIGRLIDDLGDVLGKRVVLIPKIGIYLALLRQPSVLASLFAGIVTAGLLMRRP